MRLSPKQEYYSVNVSNAKKTTFQFGEGGGAFQNSFTTFMNICSPNSPVKETVESVGELTRGEKYNRSTVFQVFRWFLLKFILKIIYLFKKSFIRAVLSKILL